MYIIPSHGETKNPHRNRATWFLVVDGIGAQLYVRQQSKMMTKYHHRQEKYEQKLVPVAGMYWEMESNEGINPTLHMSEKHAKICEGRNLPFILTVAGQLQIAYRQKLFDRLVLIAPPKLLESLKKQLSPNVLWSVVAELSNDLTDYKGYNLVEHLEDMV